ncbi:hypothetical protein QBC37DRAFT_184479 [Rhypophila decipiens]|uniref:Uncharacterized protein n=1 Tax=Rhypophila decipiens TaxID=261697 RepID=A0AAN6Y7P0_9PEZI|nr:hypothetical protein QBC37DRAFT_184479 [Rhypophila decipiens]
MPQSFLDTISTTSTVISALKRGPEADTLDDDSSSSKSSHHDLRNALISQTIVFELSQILRRKHGHKSAKHFVNMALDRHQLKGFPQKRKTPQLAAGVTKPINIYPSTSYNPGSPALCSAEHQERTVSSPSHCRLLASSTARSPKKVSDRHTRSVITQKKSRHQQARHRSMCVSSTYIQYSSLLCSPCCLVSGITRQRESQKRRFLTASCLCFWKVVGNKSFSDFLFPGRLKHMVCSTIPHPIYWATPHTSWRPV